MCFNYPGKQYASWERQTSYCAFKISGYTRGMHSEFRFDLKVRQYSCQITQQLYWVLWKRNLHLSAQSAEMQFKHSLSVRNSIFHCRVQKNPPLNNSLSQLKFSPLKPPFLGEGMSIPNIFCMGLLCTHACCMYYLLHIFGLTLLARYRFTKATTSCYMYMINWRHQWQEVVPLTVGSVR